MAKQIIAPAAAAATSTAGTTANSFTNPAHAQDDIDIWDQIETLRSIRHALHIGLESFGEVERITSRFDMLRDLAGENPDAELRPIHPTGAANTIGTFANALRLLESMECNIGVAHG